MKKIEKKHFLNRTNKSGPEYTAQTGLPYFDRAVLITIGSWYYASALESMGAKLCFRCRSVNIGRSYKK